MSKLLNILKHGGTKSVVESWTYIAHPSQVWTVKYSKEQLRKQKDHSLIRKFKKLYQETRDLGTLWTKLRNTNYQPWRPFNLMGVHI